MATQFLNQSTLEQKLVWYGISCSYLFFFIGGLYVVGSVIGWLIFAVLLLRWLLQPEQIDNQRVVPAIIWLWSVMMIIMLFCLWVAHDNWDLGTGKTIKSTIGWMKGWALIPLFLFIGYFAHINPTMIIRAVCKVSFFTLIFALVSVAFYAVGLPGDLFISPLKIIGGPGVEFFSVSLFGINPETGLPRWRFFGPWAPAAGFIACIYFVLCMQEQDRKWRNLGIAGCVAMILLSQSRAGLIIFVCLVPLSLYFDKFLQPKTLLLAGIALPLVILISEPVLQFVFEQIEQVKQARPGSTRVRSALANIAVQRWQTEALWFGHGIVERGPKIVERMPIGSHHTWFGLLYVKGLIGLLCLAIPMTATSIYLFYLSFYRQQARVAFALFSVFICYSFFENLEILAYIFWPALIYIGASLKPIAATEFKEPKRMLVA